MHILLRERHGLEEAALAEDLGQAPADLVVLSFSDSDLAAFAAAWSRHRADLPGLRLANLRRLAHPLSIDLYLEKTLSGARAILIRLLGGMDYWRYGLEEVAALARNSGIALAVVPGDGRADPRLDEVSTVQVGVLRRLDALCASGGMAAARAALGELATAAGLPVPAFHASTSLPPHGYYLPDAGVCGAPSVAVALVVFYRSFLAAADVAPVDALLAGLKARGIRACGIFVPSLKAPETARWLRGEIARLQPQVIVNATAFSARAEGSDGSPFEVCDAPVLQVALAGSSRQAWSEAERGLSPADLAMHVVLPEIDGRVFAGVVSFKEAAAADADLGFACQQHGADPERIAAVLARAEALIHLRRTPREQRRLALVLSTYPGRDDQIAHAVGLDAPQSTVETLRRLADAGYAGADIPADGDALLAKLTGETQHWPLADYLTAYASLPATLRQAVERVWGPPEAQTQGFAFRAIACGKMIVALQPERGRAETRVGDYHDPRRPPCHSYLAFYLWLRRACAIDALIHMGAHGTLEWLPGKAVALSADCAPDALIGSLPVVYPFIVNDPGEAAAAKRRLGAVTIGHMTPPLINAALPERFATVERLLDEFSTADGLDPRRRDRLAGEIVAAAKAAGLDRDIGLEEGTPTPDAITRLDAFVCDVKATQFLDGLHVFGIDAAAALHPGCGQAESEALLAALDGRFVVPGPAGSPWRGRRDVLPTGRNLFSVDPRVVPSRAACDSGWRLAEALVTRHLQDHGDYPRNVMVDLWGSATMRTAGEDFAMALALIGVAPLWDHGSGRVTGFEVLPLATLGRPRIDVTLRISGLFRDVFSGLPVLFEQAVAALAARDEPPEDNPFVAAASPRVFGPAPGAYGLMMGEALTDLTDTGRAEAAEAWLAGSAHSYGRQEGAAARADIEARTRAADAFVHAQDLPETDILAAPDYAAHEAGFAAAARALGASPAIYHADNTRSETTRLRTLREEAARVVNGRAAKPDWIAGQMRHGYRGGAEMASTLDQMASFAHLAGAVASHHFDLYFDVTLGDEAVRRFLAEHNPAALAAMRRRFRDLIAAGHWQTRRNSAAAILEDEA